MAPRKKKDTSSALVPADLETSLAPQRAEAEQALVTIQKLDLTTQAKRDRAGLVVKEIRSRISTLEEQRKTITGPLNEAKRRVDALFKPVKEYWEACNVALSERLLEATEVAEKAQREALALVAETAGNTTAETLSIAHDTPRAPEGLTERKSWSFRIVDESKVPDEYWIIDESYITKRVSAGYREIPGVEIFEVTTYAKERS